jgi:hypothetical protein
MKNHESILAHWETVRTRGMLRYLLARGILRIGIPVSLVLLGVGAVVQFVFKLNGRLVTSLQGVGFFFAAGILMGLRKAYSDWAAKEADFQKWKTYESGGNILGLDD